MAIYDAIRADKPVFEEGAQSRGLKGDSHGGGAGSNNYNRVRRS